ncbi:MAG: glycosyltransferase [Oscillospiraceae bacterium]|nr:glycosyltransferase [Oscillospiraceae bacterium]
MRTMSESNEIMVTVICLAYNHEKFIRKTLEGFVTQKTSFPFEVIVHDDASTENTANIIREIEEKYPDIIKPIYQTENQYTKKIGINKTFILPKCRGKYIA